MKHVLCIFFLLFSFTALAEDCSEGYSRNSNGRCTLTNSSVQDDEAAKACYAIADPAAQQECFKEIADNSSAIKLTDSQDKTFSDKVLKQTVARYGMPALATAYVAFYFLKNKEKLNKCASASMILLLGGAVASATTEYLAHKKYKDSLDSAQATYESEAAAAETAEDMSAYAKIQIKAYEYMIDQEDANLVALESRRKGYRIASFAYYASSAAAIAEATMGKGMCSSNGSTSLNDLPLEEKNLLYTFMPALQIYQDLSFTETIEKVAGYFMSNIGIDSAYADNGQSAIIKRQAISLINAPESIEQKAGNSLKETKSLIDKSIDTSVARIILTGTLAAYAEIMVQKTKDNILLSQERKQSLIDALSDYSAGANSGMSLCAPEDRDNKTKPECYCYNSDGTRNQIRSERTECINYLSSYTLKKPTNYNNVGLNKDKNQNACINSNNQYESDCKSCKKNKKYCNLIPTNFSKIGLAGSKWASQTAQMLNKYNTGSLSTEEFNAADSGNMAMKLQAIKKDLLKKNPSIAKKTIPATKALLASNASAFNKMIASNPGAFSTSSPTSLATNASSAKKAKKDEILANVRAKFNSSPAAKKLAVQEASFDFNMGGDSQNAISIEDDLAMNDEYKITGDINTNSTQNIFKILSNRYQTSALRRLFDDKNETQAPAASGLEINEQ